MIARYLHVALDLSKGASEVTATGAKPNAESAAAYLLLRAPDSTPDLMPDEDDQLLLIAAQKSVRHQRTNEAAQLTWQYFSSFRHAWKAEGPMLANLSRDC